MSDGVTAYVIARDEEKRIGDCLDSVAWADARQVLVDESTTDQTAEIAALRGAIVSFRRFDNYPRQRNAALDRVTTPWVLFIDADERVTPELAAEIQQVTATEVSAPIAGYWIPRKNMIWGAQIRHGGWYPDYQLRLLRAGQARYDESRAVHELVRLEGGEDRLANPLVHLNYDTLGQFFDKQRRYARLQAQTMASEGLRARPHNFILQPIREFRRRYAELEGWRDGWRGLALSLLLGWYTFETYRLLALTTARRRSR